MVSGGWSSPCSGRTCSPGGAGRERFRLAEPVGSWGSFVTKDQSGDRGKDRVEMLASADVGRQGPPILQVAYAVLRFFRRLIPCSARIRSGIAAGCAPGRRGGGGPPRPGG